LHDAGIRKRIDEALEGKGESDTDGGEASEPKRKKDKQDQGKLVVSVGRWQRQPVGVRGLGVSGPPQCGEAR